MTNIDKQVGELMEKYRHDLTHGKYDPLGMGKAIRAALQSAQVHASCHLCDCTGDIHSPDGEWRGECPYCKPTAQAPAGEAVAKWSRNTQTQEIEFEVIGDPYVINGTKLYTAPPDQSARIAELERELEEWRSTNKVDELGRHADILSAECSSLRRQLAELEEQVEALQACLAMQRKIQGRLVDQRDEVRRQLAEAQARPVVAYKTKRGAVYSCSVPVQFHDGETPLVSQLADTSALSAAIAAEVGPIQKQLAEAQAQLLAIRESMRAGQLNTLHNLCCADHKHAALDAAIAAAVEPYKRDASLIDAVISDAIAALESCAPEDFSTGHVIHQSHDEDLVEKALRALQTVRAALAKKGNE